MSNETTDTPHDAAAAEGLVAGPEMLITPGDELNEEVARVVFGGWQQHPEWYWWNTANWAGWYQESYSLPDGAKPVAWAGPKFSEEIAAVWAVVERLRDLGLGVLISNEGNVWEVEITTTEVLYQRGIVGCIKAGPICATICRAALTACRALQGEAGA